MHHDAMAAGAKFLEVVKVDTFTLLLISNFIDYRLSATTKIYIVNKAAYF
jgi:hypothetical protein